MPAVFGREHLRVKLPFDPGEAGRSGRRVTGTLLRWYDAERPLQCHTAGVEIEPVHARFHHAKRKLGADEFTTDAAERFRQVAGCGGESSRAVRTLDRPPIGVEQPPLERSRERGFGSGGQ